MAQKDVEYGKRRGEGLSGEGKQVNWRRGEG